MKRAVSPAIRLRGVRHNNLKNLDLDLPVNRLIVVTGLSGSGKSSLAFDTLFAEGQRRYIETFSPYARQFFDRMDKPRVDRIEGIPPAIAIEQTNAVRTTRSTVGTMTEVCDYMKVLWPHLAQLYCRQCRQPVRKESPRAIWEALTSPASPVADAGDASPLSLNESQLREVAPSYRSTRGLPPGATCLVTFDLPLSSKLSLQDTLSLIGRQGYQRLWFEDQILRLEDAATLLPKQSEGIQTLTIVQDRLSLDPKDRARFVEACEHAYHFGKGRLAVRPLAGSGPGQSEGADIGKPALPAPGYFSKGLHCPDCDLQYKEPSPALFSFNHPLGACPACRGFGRIIAIDYDLALPDRSKTIAQGVVKPWLTGHGLESQKDLITFCKKLKVPMEVPFEQLPKRWKDWVVEGDPDYGKDARHQWPRAWYGVKGYFRWLESKAYKMHVRVLLSRYRAYRPCPDCGGQRFQPESLLYKLSMGQDSARVARVQPRQPARTAQAKNVQGYPPSISELPHPLLSLPQFYALTVGQALSVTEELSASLDRGQARSATDPVRLALNEVRHRLDYLVQVGLGYLTLDRPTRTLSGGETERVNLTTCLGSRMVNTLFVLDEPSVGLHARDTECLVRILQNLRDTGNTVVVVEHEPGVMRAADQLLDLGPGQGDAGGHLVFQGSFQEMLRCPSSITGRYLSGQEQASLPRYRPVQRKTLRLSLTGASRHNLKNVAVEIPLNRFVCLSGVSGSGKTTLAREILLPLLEAKFKQLASSHLQSADAESSTEPERSDEELAESQPQGGAVLTGAENLTRVVLADQSSLGRTPRSNPAVYVGAFDPIRELFAQTDLARQRGLKASAFSFNSRQGQCERCRGAGFEKIEMQFLSDVFIRCPDCQGRRYRGHILEIKLPVASPSGSAPTASGAWSIADVLETTVDQALAALLPYLTSAHGRRALDRLRLLQEVGLGYLPLGQPINTLSGGESQRLKLAAHLAESATQLTHSSAMASRKSAPADQPPQSTLFIFDEPTTGLHFQDVRILMQAFQRLVDAGHSLLVIEHNLDVIRSADWVIDLGPEGGEGGGKVVVSGTPADVAACPSSHTGLALTGAARDRT